MKTKGQGVNKKIVLLCLIINVLWNVSSHAMRPLIGRAVGRMECSVGKGEVVGGLLGGMLRRGVSARGVVIRELGRCEMVRPVRGMSSVSSRVEADETSKDGLELRRACESFVHAIKSNEKEEIRDAAVDDIKRCLENKACDVNEQDRWGRSALRAVGWLLWQPHIEDYDRVMKVTLLLLEAKADACSVDCYRGKSLLHIAVERGHSGFVDTFVRVGVPINGQDEEGMTPLHEAMYSNRTSWRAANLIDLTQQLLSYGANPNKQDKEGRTPLHYAHYAYGTPLSYFNNIDVIKLLLSHGARIDAVDKEGNTPLILAVKRRDWEMEAELLANGANEHVRNYEGNTAFDIVVKTLADDHLRVDVNSKQITTLRELRFLERKRKADEEEEQFLELQRMQRECELIPWGL